MRLSIRTRWIAIASVLILLLPLVAAASPIVTTTPNAASIGRYDIYELAMTCAGAYPNP